MNIKEWKLFPTLVMEIENFLTEDECKLLFDHLLPETNFEKTPESLYNAIGDGYTSWKFSDTDDYIRNIFLEKIGISFDDKLKSYLDTFSKNMGLKRLKVSNCWYNIQKKGSLLKYHTHSSSVVSGAVFLNVDKDSSHLQILNPNPFCDYIDKRELTEYTYGNFSFLPKVGSLIIFPSYLKHGAPNLNNTENRCVISFNTNTEYER
jgi:uncharacterized protein (TIGR02466 family)